MLLSPKGKCCRWRCAPQYEPGYSPNKRSAGSILWRSRYSLQRRPRRLRGRGVRIRGDRFLEEGSGCSGVPKRRMDLGRMKQQIGIADTGAERLIDAHERCRIVAALV